MTIPLPPSGAGTDPLLTTADDAPGVSLWRAAWRRLRRNPTAIVGAVIVAAFILVALLAPLLTPYEPGSARWSGQVTPTSVPGPSPEHLLGLDRFGSDLFTQLVYGARQSLVYGVVATAIGLTAGTALGTLAGGAASVGGRIGGWVDNAVMRLVDIMLSVPSLLLAVSIAAVLGQNPYAVMIAIGVAQVPIFARLLRGSMLSQGRSDYVLAAEALGLRKRRIVMGHVLPNSLGPTVVQATLNLAVAIIEVAALSFLGLGQPDPAVAEWGRMLVAAQDRFEAAPQLALLPGGAIAITALGFTLFGEALREALDPRSRR
ncbi:ABC transporter permease [Nocardioides donggukensis]|uniref:ABC transporter permease n=1 Tax=Nocardioides donggukensis TaxID=2774019 RepID=A0A927K358_9ACTN|nr:ABC transporter permease [Nocardioides donggukensis]MBD8869514.1 ABC transporter permease [Nocardioides donggukensis]